MSSSNQNTEEVVADIKRLLTQNVTIFSEQEVAEIRDVVQFAGRIRWLLQSVAAIAKWLTIIAGGVMVLVQLGVFNWI